MKGPLDKAKAHEVVWQQVAPLFDAAKPVADMVYVYFIGEEDDGCIKIGTAKDPIGRLRTMQTGNPRRLRLEFVLVGGRDTERMLHECWEPFAIVSAARRGKAMAPGTEWFEPGIRPKLFPVVEAAAKEQIERLEKCKRHPGKVVTHALMHGPVRDALKAHGVHMKHYDTARFLAEGGGYVTRKIRTPNAG